MEKLTAAIILEYQNRIRTTSRVTAAFFKSLGNELKDRFGLTDREAIDLLNGYNTLEIMAKYESSYKEITPKQDGFDVWTEGYACTGQSAPASYLGHYKAESFIGACELAIKKNYSDQSLFKVREGKPYYWGCQLFDNEVDARKRFG